MHIQCVPNSTKKACSTSCKTCGVITHETDTNMHTTSLHIRSQHVPSVLHHCICLQCCIIGRSRKTLCCTHRARLLACILMQSLSAAICSCQVALQPCTTCADLPAYTAPNLGLRLTGLETLQLCVCRTPLLSHHTLMCSWIVN